MNERYLVDILLSSIKLAFMLVWEKVMTAYFFGLISNKKWEKERQAIWMTRLNLWMIFIINYKTFFYMEFYVQLI